MTYPVLAADTEQLRVTDFLRSGENLLPAVGRSYTTGGLGLAIVGSRVLVGAAFRRVLGDPDREG
jgi:hypothetical protein